MIVKISVAILLLSIAWSKGAYGAAYSKFFLERDALPLEYYEYGTPLVANANFAQLQAAPVQYTLPSVSGLVSPCGSPCIVTAQAVTPVVAPVAPKTTIVAHKSSVPIIPTEVKPVNDVPPGYEYSYVVYDENTGDHKAQRELYDGNVVRGEYSFIQPDGYVREVKYVADGINGFNAVVKNYLPAAIDDKKVEVVETVESGPPCIEDRNASIKEGSKEEPKEASEEKLPTVELHDVEQKQETVKDSGEETPESKDNSKSKDISEVPKESEEHKSEPEKKTEGEHREPKIDSKEVTEKASKEEAVQEETPSNEPSEKHENKSENPEESKEPKEEVEDTEGNMVHLVYGPPTYELSEVEPGPLVSYNSIIRCIQAALNKDASQGDNPSPLTYIILKKSC